MVKLPKKNGKTGVVVTDTATVATVAPAGALQPVRLAVVWLPTGYRPTRPAAAWQAPGPSTTTGFAARSPATDIWFAAARPAFSAMSAARSFALSAVPPSPRRAPRADAP